MKNPENTNRPAVQIGVSEYPQEEAKRFVLGPYLTSQPVIDKQVDDLISQLEAVRNEAKKYIEKMNQ